MLKAVLGNLTRLSLALAFPTLISVSGQAQGTEQERLSVVQNYADHVATSYANVLMEAEKMRGLIQEFLKNPTAETMAAAKDQWVQARKLYSRTEVFRFYGGPIDDEDGPEGAINAWPLDEAYIDGVLGADTGGIINNAKDFPDITPDLLRSLNEKGGEANIATGWHAIEFLLWGQDFNENGPGQRSASDFVVNGKAKNPARRAQYLAVVTDLLIEDLNSLKTAWDPMVANSYYTSFVAPEKVDESLGFILTGAVRLAGFELSQERMVVAWDTQLQEHEHSCFSDTTHFDILYNLLGIKDVVFGETMGADTVIGLLEKVNPATAVLVRQSLAETEARLAAIPAPFDQAIYSTDGRAAIEAGVASLEVLAANLEVASRDLGVELVPAE